MDTTGFWEAIFQKIAASRPSFETIIVGLLVAVCTAFVQWATGGGSFTATNVWITLAAGVAGAVFNYITSLARVVNPAESQKLKSKKHF